MSCIQPIDNALCFFYFQDTFRTQNPGHWVCYVSAAYTETSSDNDGWCVDVSVLHVGR